MVDYESALAVAQLTQEEVDAIAQHESLPASAALEMGNYLCETPEGERAAQAHHPRRDRGGEGAGRPRGGGEAEDGGARVREDPSEGGLRAGRATAADAGIWRLSSWARCLRLTFRCRPDRQVKTARYPA
jgi:hypothetical protein